MPEYLVRADEGNFVRFKTERPFERVRGSDVVLPADFIATFPEGRGGPDVHVKFEMRDGMPQCREIRIVSVDDGREIRGADVKFAAEIEKLLDTAACLVNQQPTGGLAPGGALEFEMSHRPQDLATVTQAVSRARRNTRRQIPDSKLEDVARVVLENQDAPTKAVETHFGISRRSATTYIGRAKAAGLLEEKK